MQKNILLKYDSYNIKYHKNYGGRDNYQNIINEI